MKGEGQIPAPSMQNIRRMQEADLSQVLEIEAENFSIPWSEQSFRSALGRPETDFRVLDLDEEIVGYVGLMLTAEQGDITNIAVRNTRKRQGCGRLLLQAALDKAKAAGVQELFLEVREQNMPARRLYEQAGFAPVGRRKNYYTDPVEDAILMKRTEGSDVQSHL